MYVVSLFQIVWERVFSILASNLLDWMRIEQCVIISLLLIETQPLVYRAVIASECLRSERYDYINHSYYAKERRLKRAWHCTNGGLSPSPILEGRQAFFMAVKRDSVATCGASFDRRESSS